MEKYTSSQIVRKLVSASAEIEEKYPKACDEILICAEKITNHDDTYMENYDNAISILKDDVLASTLNSERDMVKEAQFDWGGAVKGVGKDIGKGISDMWNKGKEKFREYGYQNVTKQMSKEVDDAFEKFRSHWDVNIISKEVEGIVAKYGGTDGKGGITSKIPQSLKPNFDKYLAAIKNIPTELEQANEQAIELMNGFMKKNQDALKNLATPLTGETTKPEEPEVAKPEVAPTATATNPATTAPAITAPASTTTAPQSAKLILNKNTKRNTDPSITNNRNKLVQLVTDNQSGTVKQLNNAIQSVNDKNFKLYIKNNLPKEMFDILNNNTIQDQPLKSVLTAAQKIELVKISRVLEDNGFVKQASTILNVLSNGLK